MNKIERNGMGQCDVCCVTASHSSCLSLCSLAPGRWRPCLADRSHASICIAGLLQAAGHQRVSLQWRGDLWPVLRFWLHPPALQLRPGVTGRPLARAAGAVRGRGSCGSWESRGGCVCGGGLGLAVMGLVRYLGMTQMSQILRPKNM